MSTEVSLDDVILVLNNISERVEALEKAQENIFVWLRRLDNQTASFMEY